MSTRRASALVETNVSQFGTICPTTRSIRKDPVRQRFEPGLDEILVGSLTSTGFLSHLLPSFVLGIDGIYVLGICHRILITGCE
ncbi:MAG: hypothetical protein WCF90_02015 [Methanomicrobiales archaeon]